MATSLISIRSASNPSRCRSRCRSTPAEADSQRLRAATLGDGWYGEAHVIPEIERLRAQAGRADQPFEYSTVSLGPVPLGELEALAEKGVDRVVVTPWPRQRVG